jgi:two-component system phosphate regulon sensor histidine kinase PhoR
MRMQSKLFLTYLLTSFLGLCIAGILILGSERKRSLGQLEESMLSQTRLLSSLFAPVLLGEINLAKTDSLADQLGNQVPGRITVIDGDGRVVADSYRSGEDLLKMQNHKDRPEVAAALRDSVGQSIRFSSTIKTDMLYLAAPVKIEGRIVGVARLALPLTQLKERQNTIIYIGLIGLSAAFVFSLLLSFGFSSTVTKPLKRMMLVGKRMSQGDFEQKIKVRTKDEIGELAGILNQMSEDLSHKIAQITQEKSQLDSILSSMVEGVLAVDHAGQVLLVNHALREMFELDEAPQGKPHYEVIRDHDLNGFIREVLSTRREKSREISFIHPRERDIMIESALVKQPTQAGILAVFVFHDITQLKKLERVRKDFVANVSHELRTPLTSIKGFVEALQDGAIDDAGQSSRFLSIICHHADRMNKMISDLLQLSEIESKEFKLKTEPFLVRETIEEVIDSLRRSADQKGQSLEMETDSEDLTAVGDKYRITQALTNLLDNAIKYTPEKGRVKIQARAKDGSVEVTVSDNGVGIPAKDLPRIFERFYTVDKGHSRELGGTGLGLSIVKHIIEAHQGEVRVESEPGKGSRFSFTLKKA